MRTRFSILSIVLLFFSLFSFAGESVDNVAATAAQAYTQENFDEAIELYSSLLAQHGNSAALLYDLGNVYVKKQEYGKAMLCYHRALRLDPGNEQIVNNMNYVENRVEDINRAELKGRQMSVDPDERSFLGNVYHEATINTSSDAWASLAALAFILTIGAIAVYLFCKGVLMRKAGFFSGLAFGLFSIFFIVMAFCAASEANKHDSGIITGYKVTLLTEPKEDAKSVSTPLSRGTKMTITESFGGTDEHPSWYRVRLNSDFNGWIKSSEFEAI